MFKIHIEVYVFKVQRSSLKDGENNLKQNFVEIIF